MEVILIKDVDALGGKNEVVRVKAGYARNYLFPLKAAIPATAGNVKALQSKIKLATEAKVKRIDAAKELCEKLEKLHPVIETKAGKEGKLFGAVTSQQVADKIKELSGIELDKKRLVMAPIKTIGTHAVTVRIEVGVAATIHLDIRSDEPVEEVAEAAEAEQMETPEGKPATGKAKKAAAAADAQAEGTEPAAPERAAAEPKAKKAKRANEAEADLPEEPKAKPQKEKKEKKKRVNEAEMELPD